MTDGIDTNAVDVTPDDTATVLDFNDADDIGFGSQSADDFIDRICDAVRDFVADLKDELSGDDEDKTGDDQLDGENEG